jgi:predicted DNA-binding transcriptional regulator AlpA
MLPVSPATIWRWVKQGLFVQPYKLSPGVTVWNVDEVEAWLEAHQDLPA